MSGRWWRAYDEAVDDPKLQQLRGDLFKAWFNICCVTSQNGGRLPAIEAVAFKLRVPVAKAERILAELRSLDLLDEIDGALLPHNWNGRQFKSDVTDPTNAERQRRYRERHPVTPSVTVNTVTPTVTYKRPDTETDTDTEQNQTPSPEPDSSVPSVAPSRASGATRIEPVSEEQQAEIPAILDRRSYPDAFEALWSEYRPIASPNSTKADAHRAWAKLSTADREACWTGLVRYAVWVGEENGRRAEAKRSPVEVKHLATFINRRGWEPFLEEAQRAAG